MVKTEEIRTFLNLSRFIKAESLVRKLVSSQDIVDRTGNSESK